MILVSTAASQTGDYRAKSLATLQSGPYAKLDTERSRQARGLRPERDSRTEGFVTPDTAAMAAALKALEQRAPWVCDLEKALDAPAKSFAATASRRGPSSRLATADRANV